MRAQATFSGHSKASPKKASPAMKPGSMALQNTPAMLASGRRCRRTSPAASFTCLSNLQQETATAQTA